MVDRGRGVVGVRRGASAPLTRPILPHDPTRPAITRLLTGSQRADRPDKMSAVSATDPSEQHRDDQPRHQPRHHRRNATRPGRHQARRARAHVVAAPRPAAQVAGRCAPPGSSRATGWRSSCPTSRHTPSSSTAPCSPAAIVVPMNPLLKSGEIEYFFTDSGAGSLRLARLRRRRPPRARPRRARGRPVRPDGPGRGRSRAGSAADRPGRARRRRHRGDPLHLGHHRQAQGRRADPRQPPPQRPTLGERHHADHRRTTSIMGCLPLFHVFGLTCGLNAVGPARGRR